MASLFKVKIKIGESYKIQEMVGGSRKTITLGKMSKKAAELICSRVETINSCNLAGLPYPPDVAQWLGTVGDDLHEKLSKVGLVPERNSRTLKGFLKAYLKERSDLKPRTLEKYEIYSKSLVNYFGDVPLRDITHEKAALYRVHLLRAEYSEATISKMIGDARVFFGVAVRRKLIDDNPFKYVETGSQVNKERSHYVTQEETDYLINACANAKYRLIIALGRYAGLRIPSELTGLRWSEVNWEAGRFVVHSPKTERKGKPKCIVPIFDQLYSYLAEAFETAPEGEDRIYPEIHEKKSMGSWIKKLADRSGVPLWEKPFQNMRASCSTDLADEFPSKVCAEWLGHTVQVADKHYRQVTEAHFEKATQKLQQKKECTESGIDVTPLKSKQSQEKKCAKSCAVSAGNGSQINEAANKKAVNCSVLQPTASAYEAQNGRTWSLCDSDKPFDSNDLCDPKSSHAAKSVALLETPVFSPDDQQALETIFTLWPELPPETRISIMKMIETASANVK